MDIAKAFVAGVVTIGIIAAFGLHASGLTGLVKTGGTAGQGLLRTAETGK